jgi:DnaK suppressor protein
MNNRDLLYFNKRLKRELKDLLRGVDCNFDGLNNSEENLPDIVDRASNFIDRSLSQNICDRESLRIRKIEQARGDLANGDYGICERCGEDIVVKRLKANPVARHCIECKTEIETRERLMGR